MKPLALVLIALLVAPPAMRADVSVDFAHDFSVRIALVSHSTVGPRLPRPISLPLPEYPVKMREEGVTGEARIRLTVGRDGVITNARITSASQPEFGQTLLTATKSWRFSPAVDRDQKTPVAADLEYRVLFERYEP